MNKTACILPILALLVCSCTMHRAPTVVIDASRDAIEKAQAAGADRLAPEEMGRAREKLGLTGRWIAAHDYEPARWLAEQAEVDAELAQVRAAAADAVRAAAMLDTRPVRVAGSAGAR